MKLKVVIVDGSIQSFRFQETKLPGEYPRAAL